VAGNQQELGPRLALGARPGPGPQVRAERPCGWGRTARLGLCGWAYTAGPVHSWRVGVAI